MHSSSSLLHLFFLHLVIYLTLEAGTASANAWQRQQQQEQQQHNNNNNQQEVVFDLTGNFPEQDITNVETTPFVSKRSRVRLCGQQLVNAIRMACLMEKSRSKRDTITMMGDDEVNEGSEVGRPSFPAYRLPGSAGEEEEDVEINMLGQQSPPHPLEHTTFGRFKSVAFLQGLHKRGAADNCCAKPCSIAHLATYC